MISNIVEDVTPQLGGNLDLFNKTITGTGNINITGIVTATNFVGDGSGLTGIVASGSGVIVKNSGSCCWNCWYNQLWMIIYLYHLPLLVL